MCIQRTLAAFTVVALLVAPTPARQAAAPQLELPHETFTLPNGLHVILHEDHTVPKVSVNIWYDVGSSREKPGRTGFAHLFEHLMFEGSGHVEEGRFDQLLQAAGGTNNGSTSRDRTNYWIDVPSNALELALFLESDRMGYMLDVMNPAKVDGQRDVVKNERRQRFENQPYGMASVVLDEMLYAEDHPYHWPTIGYMDDLSAARYEDVVEFYKKYYGPENASLVVAGDIDPTEARKLVEKWFGEIPPTRPVAPIDAPPAQLREGKQRTLTDRVQLPRLYLVWLTPTLFSPGDAELDITASLLASGKNSRLYKRLVYDLQIAQNVSAFQRSGALSSSFHVIVTAQPEARDGAAADDPFVEIRQIVDEELNSLGSEPPSDREFERTVNQIEASLLARMERVGGFEGKANLLNAYYFATGNPGYINEDLARFKTATPSDISSVVSRHLLKNRRVELVVMPQSETGSSR